MKPSASNRVEHRDLFFLKNVGLALFLGMILPLFSFGQCANNLATRTYDSTLTSTGFYNFDLSFPKWSPDSGLLVSVKMAAEVNSQYGFTLRNADAQPATYDLTVGQQDVFTGPQLLSPYSHITSQLIGSYPLTPGQTMIQAPFTFLDKHISSDSITNVAPFLGTGRVSVSYMSFTYTILSTFNNAIYFYGANISNRIRFRVEYLYCKSSGLLASNLIRWTAQLQQPQKVQLDWSAVNETAGRQYHLQRSSDGQTFTTIASLSAVTNSDAPDYTYSDPLPESASGNRYYRLQIDDNGSVSWSAIRQVTLAASARSIIVYPNPAIDFITVVPGQGEAGNWQIDILSANGSLLQRETYMQAQTMRVNFRTRLSAGTYFVRAVDLRGRKSFTTSFIVTGK